MTLHDNAEEAPWFEINGETGEYELELPGGPRIGYSLYTRYPLVKSAVDSHIKSYYKAMYDEEIPITRFAVKGFLHERSSEVLRGNVSELNS